MPPSIKYGGIISMENDAAHCCNSLEAIILGVGMRLSKYLASLERGRA